MNSEPHTHEVVIRRRYLSAGGPVVARYGDTEVSTLSKFGELFHPTKNNNPSARRIRKAVVLAIQRHDVGSREAASKQSAIDQVRSEFASLRPDRWASEQVGS